MDKNKSLNDIALQLEGVVLSIELTLFLLHEYGDHKSKKVSAAGISSQIEIHHEKLKTILDSLVKHLA